jgi:anti-sigma regulatory factor (Ser/Thr protein kinase)
MLMEQHQTFGPDPTNVASARQFVGGTLAGWGLDPDDVCLLTSEVVTNAVLHAGTDFTVTVKCGDERVRVEVIDLNSRLPLVNQAPTDATTGRGLGVVEGLAQAWGVDSNPPRKTVWFELAARAMAVSHRRNGLTGARLPAAPQT